MSRGETTLGMLLRIEADPSQADAALHSVRGSVEEFGREVQSTTAVALAPMREHFGRMPSELTEARHALHGVGEEIGIHIPRFIQSFLVQLGPVGPALASAFSIIAIIGIVQLVAEKLPEAFGKLTEVLTGWGESAKKQYEGVLEANRKVEEGLLHFQMRLNEAMGKPAETNLELVRSKLVETQRQIVQVTAAIENAAPSHELYAMALRSMSEGAIQVREDTTALQHQLEGLKKTQENLVALQSRLADDYAIHVIRQDEQLYAEGSKLVKEGAKLEEERTKKHYEEMLKRQQHEQEAWNAHVKFDDEARKADEQTAKLVAENEANAAKFRFEVTKTYWEEEKKGEDELQRTLAETTRLRVHTIMEGYREEQRLARENARELERLEHELDSMMSRMYAQRARHIQEFGSIASGVFTHLRGVQRQWADASVKAFEEVATALLIEANTENQSLISKAVLKAQYEAGEALSAAARYDFFAAAKHGAAAVLFGAMAAAPIISAAAAGGGGAGAGGGVGGEVAGGAAGPIALAPGARGGAPALNVVVMGQDEQAQYFAKMLTTGVRTQGVQLAASHAADGTALA